MGRWQKVVGALGLGIVVWVGGDLADVISRGGPPGGPAVGNPGQAPPGGGHDPSQFDHR